jgi:hypothetical protein
MQLVARDAEALHETGVNHITLQLRDFGRSPDNACKKGQAAQW